ncbi:MAG: Rieske (2Fe-2S) protein [Ferrovibrio sp.]|uniref:Rieske (2Fe-2S) protein n=1 Tax=Ferrovibrio sp. TaxID=1917215 RepID=UPI00391D11EE
MTATRPNQPEPGARLVALADIPEPGAKGLTFGAGKERFECFVLRWQGAVLGYVNECPHARTSLDWRPDAFFNRDMSALQCGTHGALFAPESGQCFLGPCKGKSLIPFAVRLDADGWVIAA